MSIDSYSYIDNTSSQQAEDMVAAPGNEAADMSDLYCHTNRSNSVTYFSRRGRPIATKTEDLDQPLDGVPKLLGDAGLDTTYTTQTRDISPGPGRHLRNYYHHFQPDGGVAPAGWAHWVGHEEAYGTTPWEYRTHDGGADMGDAVDNQVRRTDTWADEDLDRHTAPRGWPSLGQKYTTRREGEKKNKETRSGK